MSKNNILLCGAYRTGRSSSNHRCARGGTAWAENVWVGRINELKSIVKGRTWCFSNRMRQRCFTTRTRSTGPCACSSKSHALKMGGAGGTGAKLKHAGAALERRAPLMLGVSQSW